MFRNSEGKNVAMKDVAFVRRLRGRCRRLSWCSSRSFSVLSLLGSFPLPLLFPLVIVFFLYLLIFLFLLELLPFLLLLPLLLYLRNLFGARALLHIGFIVFDTGGETGVCQMDGTCIKEISRVDCC